MEINKDSSGNILSIKLSSEDIDEKDFLDRQILIAKSKMSKALKKIPPESENKSSTEYVLAKKELYKALLIKEIWLRKFMHYLGLYLKEIEYNPAGSMWGK